MNILIIGGSNHLGKALVQAVSSLGKNLIVTGRNAESLATMQMMTENTRINVIKCDLASIDEIHEAINLLHTITDRIDLVLNVAGGAYVGGTETCDVDSFAYMVDAYVKGQTYFIKALIPFFRKSENSLLVNFLSDWSSRKPGMECGNALYTMTKTAMAAYSECLVSEEHIHGLKVTNLYLGELTEEMDVSLILKDSRHNPDLIRTKDVCDFVLFLIKNETIHLSEATLATKSPSYARKNLHTQSKKWDK
jgi:NADP-dependent 3-hydroxy acid dehydrogenase YdfG